MRRLLALRFRRCTWPWPALELAVGDGPGWLICPLSLDAFLKDSD